MRCSDVLLFISSKRGRGIVLGEERGLTSGRTEKGAVCNEYEPRRLLSNEWHAKPAEQSPSPVLCPLPLCGSDEMYVHSITVGV